MECIERFSALLACTTESAWFDTLLRLGREYGYEKMLLAVVPDRNKLLEDTFVRSNYPAQWRSTYDSARLADIDPVVAHCITRSTPLVWEPGIFSGKAQREMYEEACGYGLRAGITLPLHGAGGELGILCLVNDVKPGGRFRSEAWRRIPALSLLRDFAFESSFRFVQPPSPAERFPVLTPRELECLKWRASGKGAWEIGRILRCSERTVHFHLGNLRRKLNATSSRQAVVKAVRMGIIRAA